MRAAIYLGPKQIEIQNVPIPELGPLDLLLDVEACGVCGSDIGSYNFGHYVEPGQIMGHEISARVAVAGSQLQGLNVGEQLAIRPMRTCGECDYCTSGHSNLCGGTIGRSLGYGMRGGFAEQILLTDVQMGADVVPIEITLPATELLWAEPLAVGVHAFGLLGLSAGDSLLVLGAGSVGLCVVAVAIAAGLTDIVVVEPREHRRNAVASLGVRAVNAGELDSDELFAGAVDTSGVSNVIGDAAGLLYLGSRVVLLGLGDGPVPWPVGGVQLIGSFAYTDEDFRTAVGHIVAGTIRLGRFVTHQFPLEETAEAMVASATDPSLVKAAIVPRKNHVNS
jgi:threonine dehydrogenase-like Zn-dependent dehydrogenase